MVGLLSSEVVLRWQQWSNIISSGGSCDGDGGGIKKVNLG